MCKARACWLINGTQQWLRWYVFKYILFYFDTIPLPFSRLSRIFSRFNMHANTRIFYLLTLFSFVSSYVVPIHRSSISREKLVERHSRFLMRQDPQPSTILTSAGSVPTPSNTIQNSTSTMTYNYPSPSSTNTTAFSSISPSLSSPTVSQPSQSPVAANGDPKYVVAHHMVGNTFPYTIDDWAEDIVLAHEAGIDGFALNMGTDSWQPARVADAWVNPPIDNLDNSPKSCIPQLYCR